MLLSTTLYSQIEKDKLLHAAVGATLSEIGFLPYYTNDWPLQSAIIASVSLPILAGVAKEEFDAFGNSVFSLEDLAYTSGAGLITTGVNVLIVKLRKDKKQKYSFRFDIRDKSNLFAKLIIRF